MNRRWLADWLAIFLVVVLLLFVFSLPLETKNSLRLFSGNATALQIFGSNYVHFDFWGHFFGNAVEFVAVALFLSFVLRYNGRGRTFYLILLFNLLIAPWIISGAFLPMDRLFFSPLAPSYGFSGIGAAFAGALVVVLIWWLAEAFKFKPVYGIVAAIALIPFSFSLTYGAFLSPLVLLLTLIAGAIFAGYFYQIYRTTDPELVLKNGRKPGPARKILVLLLPYIVLLGFTLLLFPLQVSQGGVVVNVFVHYIGLVAGMISGFFICRFTPAEVSRQFRKAPSPEASRKVRRSYPQ